MASSWHVSPLHDHLSFITWSGYNNNNNNNTFIWYSSLTAELQYCHIYTCITVKSLNSPNKYMSNACWQDLELTSNFLVYVFYILSTEKNTLV